MTVPPRICVEPPRDRSAGRQVARIAALGGIELDDAQRLVAEVTAGVTGDRWSAFEAVIFAPRQNLKTEYLLARVLAGLFVFREELVVYSAHQARTTAKTFQRLKRAIGQHPALGARIARVSNRLGAETIELTTGQAVECVARSTNSGRGFTGDCIILDEAQDLDGEQLAAILPMLSTRPNPQVIYALSLGNEKSTHLGQLRARALARIDPHVAWVEWSMAEGDRVDDPAVWAACNPAYPARIPMDYLTREFSALGPDQFAIERLGRSSWPVAETGRFAVISREDWDKSGCQADEPDPVTGDPVSFGVAGSADGRTFAIVACGLDPVEGRPVLEVAEYRPGAGSGWLNPRLSVLVRDHKTRNVMWDEGSVTGAAGLSVPDADVLLPKPAELASYCAGLFFAFQRGAVRRLADMRLEMAVGAAKVRPVRGGWLWDPSSYGAEVLLAASWAHAGATIAETGGFPEPQVF